MRCTRRCDRSACMLCAEPFLLDAHLLSARRTGRRPTEVATCARCLATAVAAGPASSIIGVSAPASAAQSTTITSMSAVASSDEITVEQLARYLKESRADTVINDQGQFDYAAAEAEFGSVFAKNFKAEWDANFSRASAVQQSVAAGAATVAKKDGYATCLLKGVGLGGLGELAPPSSTSSRMRNGLMPPSSSPKRPPRVA